MREFDDFFKGFFIILRLLLHYVPRNDKSKIYNKLYFISDIEKDILYKENTYIFFFG